MLQLLRLHRLAIALAFTLFALPAFAQTVHPVPAPVRNPNARPHQEPCWQIAGISKSTMDQRRSIEQNTHSQVQSVCADSSLTIAQKREKINQLRTQAKQESDGLLSSSQLEALHSCQAQRNHPSNQAAPHHAGAGPCGELPNSPPGSNMENKPESSPEN